MAVISFDKPRPAITVPDGSNLMRSLQSNGIPVASSCDGDGVCVKCRMKVVAGNENLSPETEFEKDLRDIHDIPNGERISCQTTVNGDVTVDASYW